MKDLNLSGRTTCYEHKFDDKWKEFPKNCGKECIRDIKYFDVQWSNCPKEVEKEVQEMWVDFELGNDHYIVHWHKGLGRRYPITAEFLKSKGVEETDEVIIHWWW